MRHNRPERTDPVWVHRNRERHRIHHNHTLFGKPVYRYRPVLDDDGTARTRELTQTESIGDILTHAVPAPEPVYRDARAARSRGAALEEQVTFGTGVFRLVREPVLVGHYADECTAGVPVRHGHSHVSADDPTPFLPCMAVVGAKAYPRYRYDDIGGTPARSTARQRWRRPDLADLDDTDTDPEDCHG